MVGAATIILLDSRIKPLELFNPSPLPTQGQYKPLFLLTLKEKSHLDIFTRSEISPEVCVKGVKS